MIPIAELSRSWPHAQRQRHLIRNSDVKGIFVIGNADGGPVLIQGARDPRQKAWQARSTEHKPDTLHALVWTLAPNANRLLKPVRTYLDRFHVGASWYDITPSTAITILKKHAELLRITTVTHRAFVDAIVRQDEVNQERSMEHVRDLFGSDRFSGIWTEFVDDHATSEWVRLAS